MSENMAKLENYPAGSYRNPHLLPYIFAKTNNILIGEDDDGRVLCIGPNANQDVIPEILRVFGGIYDTRYFSEICRMRLKHRPKKRKLMTLMQF
jgi:hypothetical protein